MSIVDSTVRPFDDSMLYLKFVCFLNYVHLLVFQTEHRVPAVHSVLSLSENAGLFIGAGCVDVCPAFSPENGNR